MCGPGDRARRDGALSPDGVEHPEPVPRHDLLDLARSLAAALQTADDAGRMGQRVVVQVEEGRPFIPGAENAGDVEIKAARSEGFFPLVLVPGMSFRDIAGKADMIDPADLHHVIHLVQIVVQIRTHRMLHLRRPHHRPDQSALVCHGPDQIIWLVAGAGAHAKRIGMAEHDGLTSFGDETGACPVSAMGQVDQQPVGMHFGHPGRCRRARPERACGSTRRRPNVAVRVTHSCYLHFFIQHNQCIVRKIVGAVGGRWLPEQDSNLRPTG